MIKIILILKSFGFKIYPNSQYPNPPNKIINEILFNSCGLSDSEIFIEWETHCLPFFYLHFLN